MTIAQLFFKKKNLIDKIELDIIITEGATATAKVTENPVENGANVNDHMFTEPMTFTTVGVVSDVSSSTIGQFTRLPGIFSKKNSRSKEAWKDLLELQIKRSPFTLVQGLKEYKNVVILTLAENQDVNTSNGLFFTATMKQIIFVGAKVVTPEQFNDPNISDKTVPAATGGLKQLKEVS